MLGDKEFFKFNGSSVESHKRGAANGAPGLRAKQTHCKHGHEFTEENTRWRISKKSGNWNRSCMECSSKRRK
jgi:hypothetical protein